MTTNTITALRGIFIHQEIYPENLSDPQIEALQNIHDFLDWVGAEDLESLALLSGLTAHAQDLIDAASRAGLHAYTHHARGRITQHAKTRAQSGNPALRTVDIPSVSANQRA